MNNCTSSEISKQLLEHQQEFLADLMGVLNRCNKNYSEQLEHRPQKFCQELLQLVQEVFKQGKSPKKKWILLEMRPEEVKLPKYPFFKFSLAEEIQYRIFYDLRNTKELRQYAPQKMPRRYWYWQLMYSRDWIYDLSGVSIWKTVLSLLDRNAKWFLCSEGETPWQVKIGINPLALKEELVAEEERLMWEF